MKKYIVIFILNLFFTTYLYSQTNFVDLNPGDEIVATPDVMAFQKYSFLQTDLYTGKVKINVPLFKIETGNISIPISLSYNTGGIKVVDEASNVGLGWNLNAGGNILRIIKDIDDRKYLKFSYQQPDDYEPNQGTVEYKLLSIGYHQKDKDFQYSFEIDKRDSSPDFYFVSAPGLKTKFFLHDIHPDDYETDFENREFKAIFINRQGIKMDIIKRKLINLKSIGFSGEEDGNPYQSYSGFPLINSTSITYYNPLNANDIQTLYGNKNKFKKWYYNFEFDSFTLKNKNGLEYFFDKKNIVETYSLPAFNTFSAFTNYSILVSSWNLSKIKDPSTNKQVFFNYEEYQRKKLINIPNIVNRPKQFQTNNCFFDFLNSPSEREDIYITTNAVKYPQIYRIKEIKWDNGYIEFKYNLERKDALGEVALSTIIIKDLYNNIITQYIFEYSYFISKENCSQPECYRLKLEKIFKVDRFGGKSIYRSFDYYYNNPLPKRTSLEKDFLGFYNNNNFVYEFDGDYLTKDNIPRPELYFYKDLKRNSILPFPLKNYPHNLIAGNYSLLPNINSLTGLIKKISYPTGGFLKFEYENPTFQFLGEEYISGGARIKKQTINDNQNTRVLTYDYKENNISSGYINNIPTYAFPTNTNFNEVTVFDKSKGGLELTNNSFIGYAKVTEYERGKGKIVYNFTSPREYKNIYETRELNSNNSTCGIFLLNNSAFPNLNYIDRDILRGRLISKQIINNLGNIKKEYTYQYQYILFDKFNLEYSSKIYTELFSERGDKNFMEIKASSSIYIERNLLTKKIITEYFNNKKLETTIKYKYNDTLPLLKETIKNNYKTEYFYPFENEVKNEPFMDILVKENRVDLPIIEKKFHNNKLISFKKYIYDDFSINNFLVAKKALLTKKENNKIFSNTTIDYRDNKGNIIYFHTKDDIYTTLVWGYNKTKLVASIKNLKPEQAAEIRGLIYNVENAFDRGREIEDEEELKSALQNLRNNLPAEAQMTSYTYDPLIGVTSITGPSGDTQYYVYDDFNRLWRIKDKEGNILKEYDYNYKVEPLELSNATIELLDHDIQNAELTFKVTSGTQGVSYQWDVQGGMIISGQGTDLIKVKYSCSSNVSIQAKCTITDNNYPDNNISLTKNFYWNNCLSGGVLDVNISYPPTNVNFNHATVGLESVGGGVIIPEPRFPVITLKINNLSGGNGDITYKWYYKTTGDYILTGTTTTNQLILADDTLMLSLCGKTTKFKCEITDNVSGQKLTVEEPGTGRVINCN